MVPPDLSIVSSQERARVRLTPAQIAKIDAEWKWSVDARFTEDALRLGALFEDRGRETIRAHLRSIGMGDKHNGDPIQVGTMQRLMESISVIYQQPASRTLVYDEEPARPDSAEMRAFRAMARRMLLNQVWSQVDRRRNLFRQCVVLFAESLSHRTVTSRLYEPYNVIRAPSAGAADMLDEDDAIAFCIRWHEREEERWWQLWQHEDDDTWRCWNVTSDGKMLPRQPYDDAGAPPFDGLPAVMVTDEILMGRAWLPIPQVRLSLALNIAAVANDVQLLVKHEGHTQTVVKTSDPGAVPDRVGADQTWKVPVDADVLKLATSPKIEEAGQTTERWLAMLALSESLPVDAFSRNRQVLTGASLMAAERDLERRRIRTTPLAAAEEALAFRKYGAIWNYYAREFDAVPVDVDADLYCSFAQPTAYQDIAQAQQVSMRELALGTESMIGHFAMMRRLGPDEARVEWQRVQAERLEFPTPSAAGEIIAERIQSQAQNVAPGQNPAAMVEGPHVPGVSNEKIHGALNHEPATSTDGASVVDAARKAGAA